MLRRYGGMCLGCRGWRRLNPGTGPCRVCGRELSLRDGACRLCFKQAQFLRRPHYALALEEANRRGQQLYFADMERRVRLMTPGPVRRRSEPPAMPSPLLLPVKHRQLVLFPPHGRDLRRGQQHGFPEADAPEVAAALKAAAADYARRHGLEYFTAQGLDRGLRILLALQDTPGAPFRASDVMLLRDLHLPARPLLKLLSQIDMLKDDRIPPVVPWFREVTADFPEPMAGELNTWFDLMLAGSTTAPRMKARSPRWIRRMVRTALPALRAWADQGKDDLRSITRDDVLDVLPDSGTPRANMLQGLRHILRPLKHRRVIFTDPTTRIICGMPTATIPLPVEVTDLRPLLQDRAAPRAALAALVIFHALTSGELRTVLATNLRDGRLFLPNRMVLLAEPVRDRLAAYLDYRNRRWPRTANPHLFLSQSTACGLEPVSNVWINDLLGMSARRLREDRLLHEAEASGGDPRRICDLFGLSVGAALRYTATVDQTGIVEYNLCNASPPARPRMGDIG
ncbi:hypothetical protein GPZ77_33280 [Streptomyces sp. QHH-9511]|uniref:hypothetical protein n=1 Tax=Streptomyces sp. QHH-9511 TaxID=2684468 RepID=UPI0013180DD5|nr:hypothetical protein [Streptomyces sp. QHH-9511]QGZ52538.1 hypothetical protein GPZ77_33280 [Streptomyces sp. QHH-9511]